MGDPSYYTEDGILEQFDDFTWWYTRDEEIELTPEIATEVMIQMSDPRSRHFGKMRHETLPPDHLFGRRLEMLTLAVLGQLRATANWHRIAREWIYGDDAGHRAGRRRGRVLRAPPAARGVKRGDPRLRLLTLALLVGAAFLVVALSGSLSADSVRDCVDGLGAAGPLLFIPISACLTVALFPGPLLAGASGLLFGTALGTPVSIVSATLGATLAFSPVALVGARRRAGARRPRA